MSKCIVKRKNTLSEGFGTRRHCTRLSALGLALLELDSVDMLKSEVQPVELEGLLTTRHFSKMLRVYKVQMVIVTVCLHMH